MSVRLGLQIVPLMLPVLTRSAALNADVMKDLREMGELNAQVSSVHTICQILKHALLIYP